MDGTGVPLVTPFDEAGAIDEEALRTLVGWLEDRGVDFLVPCGSNGEAALMSADERARVVEVVVEAASIPVIAGAGHPGLHPTIHQTRLASEADANGALVVTPFYHRHDQETLAEYYRELADAVDLPVFLYSVPAYTGVHLNPETVGELARHENILGIKDSSGNLARLVRTLDRVEDDFDVLVGSGGVYAQALDAGAAGGVLAVANVAPRSASGVYERHVVGDREGARAANRTLVELNHAVTVDHGIPGLKAAMRLRQAPAGHVRSPHRPVDSVIETELRSLIESADVD